MAMRSMSNREIFISVIGAFIAMLLASFFSQHLLAIEDLPMMLASTGASAILVFGIPQSPVSEPWPVIGGHVVSAIVGVCAYRLIPDPLIASAAAVCLAMIAMHFTFSMHPPGGATAVTAVIGGTTVHDLGFYFVIAPVFFNSIILVSLAMAAATFREENPFTTEN